MEIKINQEKLSKFLNIIGLENLDKIQIYGILEDGYKEKIETSELKKRARHLV